MNELATLLLTVPACIAVGIAVSPIAYLIYRFQGGRARYFKWLKNL